MTRHQMAPAVAPLGPVANPFHLKHQLASPEKSHQSAEPCR
ncbi:hypothetical protein CTAM01_11661 [Colletotrichum tamarilloi]|uniref:Uncharacterized protein n=1 Tax=Colletotrichum tamarilloi TaxID=1209934 RepID=A0ABQ9QWY9_9PEZI|nr:uncharacterized protein CTAM01_11661 [Colletotrichum tamarilloi]KAI3535687.1 hypothetical protein CSPX01_11211 [Colletotrichum filicis]KAK1487815.1 hypothetical protein CTAM01_11661 [Colletotrichum tamarilloi]